MIRKKLERTGHVFLRTFGQNKNKTEDKRISTIGNWIVLRWRATLMGTLSGAPKVLTSILRPFSFCHPRNCSRFFSKKFLHHFCSVFLCFCSKFMIPSKEISNKQGKEINVFDHPNHSDFHALCL